ncbi:MAG: HNH endonuclease [Nitrospirae bacterium]|nr:HNH endonuclease [Nitrospirota bacterium]
MVRTKRDVVFVDDPALTSRAAFILLRQSLAREEGNDYESWLKFRDKFLDGKKLTCKYCGKTDLKKESQDDLNILATIDHVVPLSKGGSRYDERNLLIACFPCNRKKKDMDLEEFLSRRVPSESPCFG